MPEQAHRHAAIMFTDIVGYTALMGSDEDRAFEVLKNSQEIHKSCIRQFNGTLIKEMGDGMLISFNLASEAVRCAIEIQKTCKEQDIPLKIGIHEGEMVFADADVLGDSVNIASRLQEDADEGCIYISSSVYKNIRNKADINTRFVEERTFKNVAEPVKVYQVLGDGEEQAPVDNKSKNRNKKYLYYTLAGIVIVVAAIMIWKYLPQQPSVVLDKSIAVLPLDYLSEDQNKQYLADGVMDAITGHLSKIEGLRVTPKTSVEQYRETTKSAKDIGAELNVSYLMEGSFLMHGDQVRLTIQLVTAEDEDHVWFEEYDRNWTDIFIVQREVATAIAEKVEIAITPEVKERIASIPTENLDAYDLYLRGLYSARRQTVESYVQGGRYFKKAIELDSNFALAHSGIALSYLWRSSVYGDLSPDEAYRKALPSINKALDLNPGLSEAHYYLGYINFYFQWDFKGAEEKYLESIKLNPNNADVLFSYVNYLNNMGRHEEALSWENKLKMISHTSFPDPTLFWLGRTDEAIQASIDRVKVNPSPGTYSQLGFILLNTGSYQEAIDAQLKALELAGRRQPRVLGWLAAAYAKDRQKNKANELLDELREIREKSLAASPSFYIAVIYSALDEKELAFQWLEQSYEDHDMEMVWLNTEPQLYLLHDDPRFQDLAKRVGFPE